MIQNDSGDWVHVSESFESVYAYIEKWKAKLPEVKESYFETLKTFREYYQHHEQDIIRVGKENRCRFYDKNPIEWERVLSPIELHLWYIIHGEGGVVLYPQYPIGKYFADFANPYLKIVVECDGKACHRDKDKDEERDQEMRKSGWTVFKLPGSVIYKDVEYWMADGEEMNTKWNEYLRETAYGFIHCLRLVYFKQDDFNDNSEMGHNCFTVLSSRCNHFYALPY